MNSMNAISEVAKCEVMESALVKFAAAGLAQAQKNSEYDEAPGRMVPVDFRRIDEGPPPAQNLEHQPND